MAFGYLVNSITIKKINYLSIKDLANKGLDYKMDLKFKV